MTSPADTHTAAILEPWGRQPLEHVAGAVAGDETDIHDLRVSARRLRTVLPILSDDPEGRRVRRAVSLLRALGETAGPSRDCDVMAELLSGPGTDPRAAARLIGRLEARRARLRTTLAQRLHAMDVDAAGRELAAACKRLAPLFLALVQLGRLRDTLVTDVRARLGAVGARFRPEALHRLRIRVRRLRYVAELYAAIRGTESKAAGLKALQDALGRIQDAAVFASWLRYEAALARRRGDRAVADAARSEAQRWSQMARRHHREFLDLAAGRLVDEVEQALETPRPRPVVPRRAPLRIGNKRRLRA
jgi:CHAD domain-containing protein